MAKTKWSKNKYKQLQQRLINNGKKLNKDIFGVETDNGDEFFQNLQDLGTQYGQDLDDAQKNLENAYKRLFELTNNGSIDLEDSILQQIIDNSLKNKDNNGENLMLELFTQEKDFNLQQQEIIKALQEYQDSYNVLFEVYNNCMDTIETISTGLREEQVYHSIGILTSQGNFRQFLFNDQTWSQIRRDRDFMKLRFDIGENGKLSGFNLGTKTEGLKDNSIIDILSKYQGFTSEQNKEQNLLLNYWRDKESGRALVDSSGRSFGLGRFYENFVSRFTSGKAMTARAINRITRSNLDLDNLDWWKGGDQNFLVKLFNSQSQSINLSQKSLDFFHNGNSMGRGFQVTSYDTLKNVMFDLSTNINKYQSNIIENWQTGSAYQQAIDLTMMNNPFSMPEMSSTMRTASNNLFSEFSNYLLGLGGNVEVYETGSGDWFSEDVFY